MRNSKLIALAKQFDFSPAQLALAWVLRQPNTVAIPKTVNPIRLQDNLSAATIALTPEMLQALDQIFPPPKRKKPLMII